MAPRYKLKLKQLDFISAVDVPAQETATALFVKSKLHRRKGAAQPGAAEIEGTARVVKTSDELGLVFGWALTTKANGADYFDLHGDNILDEDLIRVAAEFMEKGGATDQQHDFSPDGRVVFAMPLTAEVAKSFGIDTDTTGLMIAMKPSAEAFAKFKSGEYTGFSIAGLGEREQVSKSVSGARKWLRAAIARHERHMDGTEDTDEKSQQKMMDEMKAALTELDVQQDDVDKRLTRVVKSSLYTNEVEGHQHRITVYNDGTMYVDGATMAGAEYGHGHGVVFEGGTLAILADSGHSHTLAEGLTGVVAVPADAIVIVQANASTDDKLARAVPGARTLAAKSTRPTQTNKVASMKPIVLTEAQHAHYSKLSGDDAEAFLAKSATERDAVLEQVAKSDPVVFKGELTGFEVRKSQGDFALKMAEAAEKAEKRAADSAAREAIEKAAKETEVLKARVKAEIPHLAGSDSVKESLFKAADAIGPEAVAMLKAADDAAKTRTVAKGVNPGSDPVATDALGEFNAGVKKFAETNSIKDEGLALERFLGTTEGRALKKSYDATRAYGKQ